MNRPYNTLPSTQANPNAENDGNTPNQSTRWNPDWFDRMEGNIKGKNKDSNFGNQKEYLDPTRR